MPDTAARLSEIRAELVREMARISTVDPGTVGIGFGKRIGDGTNIAVDRMEQVRVHDLYRARVDDVDRALARLADGTYGRCEVCGEEIPAARLEHLPSAVRCVRCATRE